MALFAELMERRQEEDVSTLLWRIYDDNPDVGELGRVFVPDGDGPSVKAALRLQAQRLQGLPVGKIIPLS